MRVAVINFSGNVGKSTIAGQLLKPRLNDAPIISIETLNVDATADGVEVEKMKGRKFGELQEQLASLDSVIVDVGASNVEEFIRLMQQYEGSHNDYDLFIVPVTNTRKQQQDTVHTIQTLSVIGVPARKIRLLFNNVELDDSVEDVFAALFGFRTSTESFVINPEATVRKNEVFDLIKGIGLSIDAIAKDPTDYREKLKTLTDPDERSKCVRMMSIKRLAGTATRNLDAAFAAVTA